MLECNMLRILAATDFSDDGRVVVDFAANMVRQCGGKMYLLHVVEPCMADAAGCLTPELLDSDTPGSEHQLSLLELTDRRARRAAEKISDKWDIPIYGKAEEADDVVDSIHRFCERHHIDLLVIGNRHHSLLSSILLGNTAERLMRSAKIPVTVVPCSPSHL